MMNEVLSNATVGEWFVLSAVLLTGGVASLVLLGRDKLNAALEGTKWEFLKNIINDIVFRELKENPEDVEATVTKFFNKLVIRFETRFGKNIPDSWEEDVRDVIRSAILKTINKL